MSDLSTRKNYVVLGYGNIGKNIVYDLVENNIDGSKISVYDPNLIDGEERISGAVFFRSDPFEEGTVEEVFNEDNVVISAMPPQLMQKSYDYTIRFGGNLIDIASVHFDISKLLENKGDFLIIPEFGIAPGISHFLVGHFMSQFETTDKIKIYVGGIPIDPIPPLEYRITWSPTALINMYLNPVEIYEDGALKIVQPLSGVEKFEMQGFNHPLEAFYTDGLSTLKYTVKNVNNMFEKTVRHKGHAEKITLLKSLGFFDTKSMEFSNQSIRPRDLTEELFNQKLKNVDTGDALLMRVSVEGTIKGKIVEKVAYLTHVRKAGSPFTAMSQTTGYPPSIIAQMIVRGEISGLKGYLPPQEIGQNVDVFNSVIREMIRRGIGIEVKE